MPFENQLLDKLLRGVLEHRQIPIRTDLIQGEKIEEAISFLPISLSENQRAALHNAWCSEISYIQGPPGTGKSHTITALMLSAIFLKKRVLMVSHKKAAVEVVRRQVEKYLGEGGLVYLGAQSEQRRHLRGQLQQLCDGAGTLAASRRVKEMHAEVESVTAKVLRLLREVEALRSQIKNGLDNERNYYQQNEDFLQRRNNFSDEFGIELNPDKFQLVTKVPKPEHYRNQLSRIHEWLHEKMPTQDGCLSRKEWLHILRVFNKANAVFNAHSGRLKPSPLATQYLLEHLELTLAHEQMVKCRARVLEDYLKQQRQLLARKEGQLQDGKDKLIRCLHRYSVQFNLLDTYSDVERFDKMLHWKAPHIIRESMSQIDFRAVTNTFPLWVGEMRNLGEFLPFVSELFDLVVVDEASQVNIAEIIPAFYRGSRFCVVGDKKQLGLNAAGLFSLNRTFEQLIWNQNFSGTISYDSAKLRALRVSESSILDFITCEMNQFATRKATLNEHFRSLPQLASFTSDHFYKEEGGLRLMKELPIHLKKKCFKAIEVGGKRESEFKVVATEVEELVKILRDLIHYSAYTKDPDLKAHGFADEDGKRPTIGVISFLTNQRSYIRTRLEEEFTEDQLAAHTLMVGTPEDFQGNERHIIIMTLGLDGTGSWSKSHYENPQRLNVATSRAICFTYTIFGGIPETADLIKRYLRHFGATWKALPANGDADSGSPALSRYAWRYHPNLRESEFEIRVDEYLKKFIEQYGGNGSLKLYNQVESCGQKRLDFVLFNECNGECCAVEVDGQCHYTKDGRSYSEAHVERISILKRAGWKVVHVPYYHWYRNGWLCDTENSKFHHYLNELYQELRTNLAI